MPSQPPVTRVPSLDGANPEQRHRRAHDQIANFIDSLVNAGIFIFINGGWIINPAVIPKPFPPYLELDEQGGVGGGGGIGVPGPPGPAGKPGQPIFMGGGVSEDEAVTQTFFPPGITTLIDGYWQGGLGASPNAGTPIAVVPNPSASQSQPNFALLMRDSSGRLGAGDVYADPNGEGMFGRPNMIYIGQPDTAVAGGFAIWDPDQEAFYGFFSDGGGTWQIAKDDGTRARFQIGDIDSNGTITVDLEADQSGILVSAHTSQTNPLTKWMDSTNATLSQIDKNGYFMTRKTSAPADGDIATSEVAIWFDPTPGSAAVNFKGKNSSGTVVTATVPLT